MKGLLRKDWYMTMRYMKRLLVIAFVFLLISAAKPENGFFMVYPGLLFCLLPATLYSYDEREKWTVYVETLPVSRALYVTEKYLFGALVMAAYLALLTASYLCFGAAEYLPYALLFTVALGFLAPALMLPVLLRLGAEKGRLAYLFFIGAMFGGTLLLTGGEGVPLELGAPQSALMLLPLILYALSWRLSVALYRKREL